MAKQIKLEVTKTYASAENAAKAFEAKFGNTDVRYIVLQHTDGRFYPVAIGMNALQFGVHFHFHVVA